MKIYESFSFQVNGFDEIVLKEKLASQVENFKNWNVLGFGEFTTASFDNLLWVVQQLPVFTKKKHLSIKF